MTELIWVPQSETRWFHLVLSVDHKGAVSGHNLPKCSRLVSSKIDAFMQSATCSQGICQEGSISMVFIPRLFAGFLQWVCGTPVHLPWSQAPRLGIWPRVGSGCRVKKSDRDWTMTHSLHLLTYPVLPSPHLALTAAHGPGDPAGLLLTKTARRPWLQATIPLSPLWEPRRQPTCLQHLPKGQRESSWWFSEDSQFSKDSTGTKHKIALLKEHEVIYVQESALTHLPPMYTFEVV